MYFCFVALSHDPKDHALQGLWNVFDSAYGDGGAENPVPAPTLSLPDLEAAPAATSSALVLSPVDRPSDDESDLGPDDDEEPDCPVGDHLPPMEPLDEPTAATEPTDSKLSAGSFTEARKDPIYVAPASSKAPRCEYLQPEEKEKRRQEIMAQISALRQG